MQIEVNEMLSVSIIKLSLCTHFILETVSAKQTSNVSVFTVQTKVGCCFVRLVRATLFYLFIMELLGSLLSVVYLN